MDRGYGHRAILSAAIGGGIIVLSGTGRLVAQGPPPTTATPWVQASPSTLPKPPSAKPLHLEKPPVLPPGGGSPFKDEVARSLARKREEELARQGALPMTGPVAVPLRLVPRLSPEENEAYQRNLALWRAMPPDERKEIRGLAAERIREETEKAYANSGLNLNEDQREVFKLRYRQERRRLEREIQETAAAERSRRIPEIMDRLKREFGGPNARP